MNDRQMFSILCPSRGRPDNIARLAESLEANTAGPWELLVRLDGDDPLWGEYVSWMGESHKPNLSMITAPRVLMSQLWNDLVPYALGDIFMLCGDDITFNTWGWDEPVRQRFPKDGIAVVHGDDLSPNAAKFGTHPFVTRKWVETLGYLAPPLFSSDYNDVWLHEVAEALGRRFYRPDVITEHHHPAFAKATWDLTHKERLARHNADDMDRVWRESAARRAEDIEKLRAVIQ